MSSLSLRDELEVIGLGAVMESLTATVDLPVTQRYTNMLTMVHFTAFARVGGHLQGVADYEEIAAEDEPAALSYCLPSLCHTAILALFPSISLFSTCSALFLAFHSRSFFSWA